MTSPEDFRSGTLSGSTRFSPDGSQDVPADLKLDSRVPVSGVGVSSGNSEEDGQLAPLHAIYLLVTRLLHVAQEGILVEEKAPLEEKRGLRSAGMPVCFSCGRQGHGVNRCFQMHTSFPFLPPGWSVDVRNGQYRATRTERTGLGSPPGNEEWSGWEVQPPGSSGIKARLTLVGEWDDVRHLGSCRWGRAGISLGPGQLGLSVIGRPVADRL